MCRLLTLSDPGYFGRKTKAGHKITKICGILVFDSYPLMIFESMYGGKATSIIVTTLSRLDNKPIRTAAVPHFTCRATGFLGITPRRDHRKLIITRAGKLVVVTKIVSLREVATFLIKILV